MRDKRSGGPEGDREARRNKNAAAAKRQGSPSSVPPATERTPEARYTDLALRPDLDEQAERYSYFAEGYRLGFDAGHFVGVGQGETAEAELWSDALGIARLASTQASHAELQRRRAHTTKPCNQQCDQCSRCIYAASYRRQRGDYLGLVAS